MIERKRGGTRNNGGSESDRGGGPGRVTRGRGSGVSSGHGRNGRDRGGPCARGGGRGRSEGGVRGIGGSEASEESGGGARGGCGTQKKKNREGNAVSTRNKSRAANRGDKEKEASGGRDQAMTGRNRRGTGAKKTEIEVRFRGNSEHQQGGLEVGSRPTPKRDLERREGEAGVPQSKGIYSRTAECEASNQRQAAIVDGPRGQRMRLETAGTASTNKEALGKAADRQRRGTWKGGKEKRESHKATGRSGETVGREVRNRGRAAIVAGGEVSRRGVRIPP
jgi:hypothetical protein